MKEGDWKAELNALVERRKVLDDQIAEKNEERDGINKQILRILKRNKKRVVDLRNWQVIKIRPREISWDVGALKKWYRKHAPKLSVPVLVEEKVDTEVLEKHISANKVPQEILEQVSDVGYKKAYVQIRKK